MKLLFPLFLIFFLAACDSNSPIEQTITYKNDVTNRAVPLDKSNPIQTQQTTHRVTPSKNNVTSSETTKNAVSTPKGDISQSPVNNNKQVRINAVFPTETNGSKVDIVQENVPQSSINNNIDTKKDKNNRNCLQVITYAYNPTTLEQRHFSTPCAVLDGWVILNNIGVYGEGGRHPVSHHDEVDANMTTVYYPTDIPDGVKVPVIFFASGYGSADSKDYETLLTFIASHGYYVIYAKHAWDNVFANMDKMLDNANGILPKLDTTRIGVVGHSLGGGYAFNILKHFSDMGYGENGRFVMVLEGYYAYNLTKSQMRHLPANTNVIMQQYGVGGNNPANDTDPRITLTEFYLLDSIKKKQKDWQIVEAADHGYPYGSGAYSTMQGILKPLDALMAYTFKGDVFAHAVALEQGSDDPYNSGNGIQVVNPTNTYTYKCNGDANVLFDYCNLDQFTVSGEEFTYIATDVITKPAYNVPYIEAIFASKVTRITDRSIQTGNFHPYPKQGNAWNSDMSIIRMGYRLYDATSFQELAVTAGLTGGQAYAKMGSPYHGPADMRWSKSNPNLMYVLDSSKRYKKVTINPNRTDTNTSILIDFNPMGYSNIETGSHEGNLDHNDEYILFTAQQNADNRNVYMMLYKLGQANVEWTKISTQGLWKEKDDGNASTVEAPMTFDWASVDPTATYIVTGANNQRYIYDMNLSNERLLAATGAHGDMGIDVNGNPVYVQFQFFGEQGIWSHNLETLEAIKLLPSKYNGGHVSCRNVKRLGWCYVNTSQEGYKEVFALKLDAGSGKVQRFAQTHVSLQNRGCTQVSVSPDGQKVLFSSDWSEGDPLDYQWDKDNWMSCTNDSRRIKLDTYQVELP